MYTDAMPSSFPTPSLSSLSFSLASLRLTTPIGAPSGESNKKQRKAPAAAGVDLRRWGHHGLSSDASASLVLVAVSRLVQATDEGVLRAAAQSPLGVAVLAALRPMVLRVAKSPAGGASPALSETHVATLFNMAASTLKNGRQYEAGLSLPQLLPHARARALVDALLASLSVVRTTELGARVGARLLKVPAPTTWDAEATADVAALVAAAERETTARLLLLNAAGSSSGDASTAASTASNTRSVTPQPQLPLPVPQPPPSAQPPPPVPIPVAAVEPFALDGAVTLRASVERLVRSSLRRPLAEAESAELASSLEQSLSLLQAGGAEAQRRLLETPLLTALVQPSASFLIGMSAEAAESGIETVREYGERVVAGCSAIAGALFSAAFGL